MIKYILAIKTKIKTINVEEETRLKRDTKCSNPSIIKVTIMMSIIY